MINKSSTKETNAEESEVLSCGLDSDSDISLLDHPQVSKEINLTDLNETSATNKRSYKHTEDLIKFGKNI